MKEETSEDEDDGDDQSESSDIEGFDGECEFSLGPTIFFKCDDGVILSFPWELVHKWAKITELVKQYAEEKYKNLAIHLPTISSSILLKVSRWVSQSKKQKLNLKLANMCPEHGIDNWTSFLNYDYATTVKIVGAAFDLGLYDLFHFAKKALDFKLTQNSPTKEISELFDVHIFRCMPCNVSYPSYERLKKHHMDRHYNCNVNCCGDWYKTWPRLKKHFSESHLPNKIYNYDGNTAIVEENWFLWRNNGLSVNFIDQLDEHQTCLLYKEMVEDQYENMEGNKSPELIDLDDDPDWISRWISDQN